MLPASNHFVPPHKNNRYIYNYTAMYVQTKREGCVLCLNVYECEVGRMQIRTRTRGLFEVSLSLLAASRMRGWGAVKQSLLAASFPIGFSCRIYTLFN
jgi:hypothetical protein